jgi:outer membrane protein, multidrug efflux system
MRSAVTVCAAAVLFCGCAVGPNYRRPSVPVPDTYRGATTPASAASIADKKWAELFGDVTLNGLIGSALERNFDLRMAAARVQQARA